MRFLFLFFFGFGAMPQILGQFSEKKLVDEANTQTGRYISTGDMNNDGLVDVIGARFDTYQVFYNMGDRTFSEPTIIIEDLDDTQTYDVADLNGDGFLDLLGTDFNNGVDENFWVPNNGDGTFGEKTVIYDQIKPYHIYAFDMDNDGDMDVLTNSSLDGELRLFKNTDGLGTFDAGNLVNNTHVNGRLTRAADFDGDGDWDLVSTGSGGTQLTWFENLDGQANSWGVHLVQGPGNGLESLDVGDLDGDGDIDILKGVYIGSLAWHANDGTGNFGEEQIIAPDLSFMASVFVADLDGDGDMDVMSTHDDAASWWENTDGQGTFGAQQNFATGLDFPRGICAADLDNDGDNDVVVNSQRDDAIYWFENYIFLSAPDNILERAKVYPNPAGNVLHIDAQGARPHTVTVGDVLGKTLLEQHHSPTTLDISSLPAGVFMVTIKSGSQETVKKIVKL